MSGQARFADVLAVGEYAAVLGAATASWVGDMMAKAALTYLVFVQTGSVVWSAAMFAVDFFPWVVGGPLLSARSALVPQFLQAQVYVVSPALRGVRPSAAARHRAAGVPRGHLPHPARGTGRCLDRRAGRRARRRAC